MEVQKTIVHLQSKSKTYGKKILSCSMGSIGCGFL
jgi:hypothetical protein